MAAALFATVSFNACNESDGDDDTEFADWQNKNETYFSDIYSTAQSNIAAGNDEWKIITTWSVNDENTTTTDHIVVRVLEEGTGSGCPLYNDSVQVHYRGRLIPSASYPLGYKFDSSYDGDTLNAKTAAPSKGLVSGYIDGFATALQNMHIGDHWLVYVPHQLGYGSEAQTSIPAYSTLVFEMYLCAYYHVGTSVTPWSAKRAVVWTEE